MSDNFYSFVFDERAKTEKFYKDLNNVVAYPAMSDFMTKLFEEDKEEYLEVMVQKALGDYYKGIIFIRNVYNCHPVQARLPFELNLR